MRPTENVIYWIFISREKGIIRKDLIEKTGLPENTVDGMLSRIRKWGYFKTERVRIKGHGYAGVAAVIKLSKNPKAEQYIKRYLESRGLINSIGVSTNAF